MTAAARAVAEARRDQAIADIEALDVQVSSGELDSATATRLRRTYETDLADALAELGDGDGAERLATVDDDAPAGATAPNDRLWRWGIAGGVVVVAIIVLVVLTAGPRGAGDQITGGAPDAPSATPTTRDLSTVTNEELEGVIAENPDIVPMRLALVERYLRDGELANAQHHAEEAAVRADTFADRARALRYLGWTTALLGDAVQGEGLIVQSLAIDPANPNSLYFLARVRFELLGRPDLALPPLEELLQLEMSDEQRTLIDSLLADVQAALASGTTSIPAAAP